MKAKRKTRIAEMDFSIVVAIYRKTDDWGLYPDQLCDEANLVAAQYRFEGAPYNKEQTERSCRRLMKNGLVRIVEYRRGHSWILSKHAKKRMASEHGLYRCSKCGSTDVRAVFWVACNAMGNDEPELLEDFDWNNTKTQRCLDCKTHGAINHISVSAALRVITEAKKAS